MKMILAGLALVACTAFAADTDGVLGHVQYQGEEIELYTTRGACVEHAGLSAARYPSTQQRSPYIMGCWKPLNDTSAAIVFEDGYLAVVKRFQIVAPGGRDQVKL